MFPDRSVLNRPVFIIGCGRSGTTALGQMLERHPQLAYLNEPRHIWLYEPRTDIWTDKARRRRGRLRLTAGDLTALAAARIADAFAAEVRLQKARRLVEKLPINTFRIGFIAQLFPDALFVHLVRNGIEVARSIAKYAEAGPWFGHDGYKWQLLSEYAREKGEGNFVDLSTSDFLRGILEWRLSVSCAFEDLRGLPGHRTLEIRYERFVEDPVAACDLLERFIGIDADARMRQFAATQIQRQSAPAEVRSLPPEALAMAGDLLLRLGYL